ncbi:MAG: sodium:proton antiporter [Saprospiraceae bacterium]|nr:sodium:proton antiporter [Saprospiraceae bacterium]HMW40500.1 sodium:proton antiporter [Saprospiraceae bacterium]HMX89271.1 sodium:proton antiporter [Saprospiraceae bacterium]HMZ40625.1 sodium:proton antiporter [Saprospiraceae bacterium]HNA63691.1 sodium:proton antiporter [Saprospiraceae bacterium]
MNSYYLLISIISLSAFLAYINQRWIKLPFVIGLFALTTILSIIILSSQLWLNVPLDELRLVINSLQLDHLILNYMLGFLLFAGALHTNWNELKQQIKPVSIFAISGVLISTIIIAHLLYLCLGMLELQIELIYCYIFGALISPTDPIAVLGILAKSKVPKRTKITIIGESLFNDGIGVVVFLALLQTLHSGEFSLSNFGFLFIREAVGGILMGLLLGYLLHLLLRSIDHFETEVLVTLALVMTGYTLSNSIHLSGALAMVVMGLMAGNYKTNIAMSDTTLQYVLKFWELVDVILNAILFILIALVLILIDFNMSYFIGGFLCIIIVLISRAIVVFAPHLLLPRLLNITGMEAKILTWGGLRGGLSLALVLSLPESKFKPQLLVFCYCCVFFSILVQGLTIGKLTEKSVNS